MTGNARVLTHVPARRSLGWITQTAIYSIYLDT